MDATRTKGLSRHWPSSPLPSTPAASWRSHVTVPSRTSALVRRDRVELRPDPTRLLLRAFMPGQELPVRGVPRADAVVARVLAIPEEEATAALTATLDQFHGRPEDLLEAFRDNFASCRTA